jgi:hypothetical protein
MSTAATDAPSATATSSRPVPRGMTPRKRKDGTPNPKFRDVLSVDKPLAGQLFGVFQFLSPEKIIKDKERFFFDAFIRQWDLNHSLVKFEAFIQFVAFKYHLSAESLIHDLEEFVEEEKAEWVKTASCENDYKTFLDREETRLQAEYTKKHKFQTNVRGVKNSGNFPSQEEAEFRARLLRSQGADNDVCVGPVGTWLTWDPEAYKTGRVEYLEEELNQLMHEKEKNEAQAKAEFAARVRETKEKAIQANKENAAKFGTKITQDINANGDLVGVSTLGGVERTLETLDHPATIDDIHRELFVGDNIVPRDTDHGLSALSALSASSRPPATTDAVTDAATDAVTDAVTSASAKEGVPIQETAAVLGE